VAEDGWWDRGMSSNVGEDQKLYCGKSTKVRKVDEGLRKMANKIVDAQVTEASESSKKFEEAKEKLD
jgi:hypothetical protein